MVVALIGVFGVMVLIPFSVQQAQSGLDRDEAVTIGRNAFEQFSVEGFRFVERRVDNGQEFLMTRIADHNNNNNPVNVGEQPGVAVIDPLSRTSNGNQSFCDFQTFNLLDTNYDPLSTAMARKMFRSTDDLQFGAALDDLGPPQQIYDLADGQPARRQSEGRLSWNAVLAPVKVDYGYVPNFQAPTPDPGTWGYTFRMHVLVHKDRDLDRDGQFIDYPKYSITAPAGGVLYGGGTVAVSLAQGSVLPISIRRDDWVMLRNNNSNVESGYGTQVGFFRVTGVDSEGGFLTLEGPDFGLNANTTLHHLVVSRNGERSSKVINVYERTMQWEQKSNWN